MVAALGAAWRWTRGTSGRAPQAPAPSGPRTPCSASAIDRTVSVVCLREFSVMNTAGLSTKPPGCLCCYECCVCCLDRADCRATARCRSAEPAALGKQTSQQASVQPATASPAVASAPGMELVAAALCPLLRGAVLQESKVKSTPADDDAVHATPRWMRRILQCSHSTP